MIYTSYFARLKDLPENVVPISICGKAPDWYNGLQYKRLAPKYDFFTEWKKTHDDNYYIEHFKSEVLSNLFIGNVLDELQSLFVRKTKCEPRKPVWMNPDWHIALICYEKPEDFCHRHLVSDWLRSKGVQCEEYKITVLKGEK